MHKNRDLIKRKIWNTSLFILLIIFIGIYINKKNIGNETVTATEVNNIEEYISKIYMWQEITEEALPKFNNINDA